MEDFIMNQNQISPQEQAYQLSLINNPKYDSDWVAEAAKILSNEDNPLTEGELAELNALQLSVINEILASDKSTEDKNDIINTLFGYKDLNATQMRLYWIGLKNGLNNNIMVRFLNSNIPYAKSNYAIQAICEGFTGITEYLNDFNANQIAEIYAGMKDGVDYKIYAKPEYSAELMNLIRHAMVTGINVTLTFGNSSIEVNPPVETEEK